ncbi:hypothetical protein KKP04_02025 [Rhodomicrobium sp. Az07]|uniref:hypothetical protein n=1 Tax=Rhodomicrobium sp. Az07 TaxID=2839034 RepID=UPI001BECD41D|nr:hypothetical protein [Rhodomicrobium sp. Az07]MBT3069648.1 hypothetical protein [Rhodomicrobium sp. Az07]
MSGTFKTISFDDGTYAVVSIDADDQKKMEVVATFFDVERARDYASKESGKPSRSPVRAEARAEPRRSAAHQADVSPESAAASDLSERQASVLKALRNRMNEKHEVEMRAASLAGAAKIPLGSLHSVLQSLEKKNFIKTARTGSAKAPAIYEVLEN